MMRNWFNTFLSSPQDTKALFLSLSLLCLLAGTPLQTRGGLVRAQGMSVALERGGVATLGHGGSILTPLAAPPPRLFTLTISQAGATHGPQQTIASGLAAEFDLRLNPEPDGNDAILTYQGFKEGVRRVVCTIGPAPGQLKNRINSQITCKTETNNGRTDCGARCFKHRRG